MLPSLLANDIRIGLKQFLAAGFAPAAPFLHGLMRRFVEDVADWLKGPDLQVGLPLTCANWMDDYRIAWAFFETTPIEHHA